MAGVAGLVDRVVALPPGPELSAALAVLPWEKVPNARLVEVVQARSRQLSHEHAEYYAGIAEIAHTVALESLPESVPGSCAEAVVRAGEQFEWASREIAAGLTLTAGKADRELAFAIALCERLPLVHTALQQGRIDLAKARVFVDHLDPGNGEISAEQARRLCERFLPVAPGLTVRQLAARLYKALLAIGPQLRRRRYERAVQGRGVAVYLDPRSGTATLVGDGLPADEAAAAAERNDRMVDAAKRAGHPGTRGQIGADIYLGMLTGDFHGLTEAEIIEQVLAKQRPEDSPHPDTAPAAEPDRAAAPSASATGAAGAAGAVGDRWAGERWVGERVATREGIEIRAGLGTLAGCDDRPGEIPGLGPVGAHIARAVAVRQRRGARWRFALLDPDGYLLLAGPLRRRPRTGSATQASAVRGGVVEVHLTLDELARYTADPALAGWHGVLAEITQAWDDRDELRTRLAANPTVRFARGALADHVCVRDRTCIGVGCMHAARRSDLDHTRDHGLGGQTVAGNIGPACRRHHADKDRGWRLTQPEPGLFRWVSPLGRIYWTRGEPIRPNLPDPDPAPNLREETAAEVDQRLRRYDPRMLERPVTDPPRPPPPRKPDPPPDGEAPPF